VLALLLLAVALPARGQPPGPGPAPSGPPEPGDPRPLRLGVRGRLDAEYNDNVFRSARDRRPDVRESLTPETTLRLAGRDLRVSLTYAPSLVHSSAAEDDLLLFQFLDGTASYALTERLTLEVADRFVENDDPALSDPRGARRGRATTTQNTLVTDLLWRREPWTLTPRYSVTTLRTETEDGGDGPAEATTTVHALGADATLEVFRRTTLGAGYELTLADVAPGDDFVGHRGRARVARALDARTDADARGAVIHRDVRGGTDFDIYRGDVGVRRDVGPRGSVEARAGYAAFDPAAGRGETIPEVLLRGVYAGRAVRVSATAVQAFQETFLEAENVGVTRTREAAVEVRYEATPRVGLGLRVQVAENRFLQPDAAGAAAAPTTAARTELLVGAGVELDVRLTRRLVLGVGYEHTRADSSVRGLDYEQNRVRVGLTVIYD
jgi:hypothetical protein